METGNNKKKMCADGKKVIMRIGIATDFGWFELKRKLIEALNSVGYELADIGEYELVAGENYPDFVVPISTENSEIGEKQIRNQLKSGVIACEAVNKIPGVCAAVITRSSDPFAEFGIDDLYVRCLGGQIKGYSLSNKKVMTFLNDDSSACLPSNQRLAKLRLLGMERKMKFA